MGIIFANSKLFFAKKHQIRIKMQKIISKYIIKNLINIYQYNKTKQYKFNHGNKRCGCCFLDRVFIKTLKKHIKTQKISKILKKLQKD